VTLFAADQHGELITAVPRTAPVRSAGSRPTEAGNHDDQPGSEHTRHRGGGDSMAAVTLNANDAAELAEMRQFLADWLNRDPSRLGASLEDFVGHPAYNTCQLREDLDRFIFLLGGSDGESLFGPPR
jgi:hypothetical protein